MIIQFSEIIAAWFTVRLKMYYQKKFKQGCYMVNFTKFMIHMHLCIKNKINLWALFWLDQNYRFFYSKIDCFLESFFTPKIWYLWISKCHNWTKINNECGIFKNYTWISTKPIKTCPPHSLYLSEGLQEQQISSVD